MRHGLQEQTPEQREAAFKAAGVPLSQTPPKVGEPIPGTNLQFEEADIANLQSGGPPITGADLISVPTPVVTTSQPESPPSISGIKTEAPAAPELQSDIEKSLAEAETTIAGLGTREGELQKRIGTQEIGTATEIAELNEQIEMNKIEELTLKERAEARNVLDPFATGEAARAQKALAIDTLRLSARANALQAKFSIAEKQARIAIDAEFAEKEQDLKIKRQNIVANYDKLTSAQKKRADALLLQLDKEDKFVSEQKEAKKEINKQILEAIKGGAPKEITDEAFEMDSLQDALGILSPYLKEKEKKEKLPSDIETFRAFFPNVDITSPQGREQFLKFQRQQAEATRKPEEIKLQPSAGFFDPKVESSIREDFVELTGRYKVPNAPTEDEKSQAFTTLRNLYSPQEATDETLRNLIGIAPPKPTGEIQVDQTTQEAAQSWLGGIFGKISSGFKRTFFESPDRIRFDELDRRFRRGERLSETEMEEYRNLLKRLK